MLCNIKGFAKKNEQFNKDRRVTVNPLNLDLSSNVLVRFHFADWSMQGQATVEGQWP